MTATDKEKFELLYEMLRSYYQSLFDGTVKAAGVLLIIAGWVASSDSLRRELCLHHTIRWVALALPCVAFTLYLFIAIRIYVLSNSAAARLDALQYMDAGCYSNYRLRWFTLLVYCIADLALTVAIIVVIKSVESLPCA
jgi:hypothetical protein